MALAAPQPRPGLVRRLGRWREAQIAGYALAQAGDPTLVLDLSWEAGRFWPLLAEHPTRVILAASASPQLLAHAAASQPAAIAGRICILPTSAFALDLPDNAVESIFCLRLLQRVGDGRQRLALLREMHRVTRDTLIVSLWVDGNYRAWRHRRHGTAETPATCFVVPRTAIAGEIREAGFSIVDWHDALPHYAMGRTYVLRKEPRP